MEEKDLVHIVKVSDDTFSALKKLYQKCFLNANYADLHKFYKFTVLQKLWNTAVYDLRKFAFIREQAVRLTIEVCKPI